MSQLKYYNGSSWVPAIVGAQGLNGIQGSQGLNGAYAAQGVQGIQGYIGQGFNLVSTSSVTLGFGVLSFVFNGVGIINPFFPGQQVYVQPIGFNSSYIIGSVYGVSQGTNTFTVQVQASVYGGSGTYSSWNIFPYSGANGVQGIQGIQGSTGSNNYGWSTIATGTATSGNVISVSGISSLYANGEFEFVFPSPTTSTATSAYLTINGDTGTYFLKASQGQTLYANTSVIGASNISNSFVVKIWGASDSPKVVMYSSSVSAYQTWIYVPPTNVAITSLSLTLTTGTFTGGTWYLRARP